MSITQTGLEFTLFALNVLITIESEKLVFNLLCKYSLILIIAISRSFHWELILGVTFKFLLIVGFKVIKANCSLTKVSCGTVIFKIFKFHLEDGVLDISTSDID